MSRPVSLFLRLASLCLFLGLAWIHLFWDAETPSAQALAKYGGVFPNLDSELVSRGMGGWFLASGLAVILWQPKWLVVLFIVLATVPLSLFALGSCAVSETPISNLLGALAILLTPLILCLGDLFSRPRLARNLARLSLSISFITLGILASGAHYQGPLPLIGEVSLGSQQPKVWVELIATMAPELDPLKHEMILRIVGGLAILASLGIWSSLMVSISAIAMSLLAMVGSAAITTSHLSGDTLDVLHRWAPETILRMPLVILPFAVWQMTAGSSIKPPNQPKRRKLKRVEPDPEEFEIIMEDDDRFVPVDEIR
tara:strand:- start:30765 stop:31703 length:939 start_codon:yes stop_codon:yes gene_type:complete